MKPSNDLHRTAELAERARQRYHSWRFRYYELFGEWPDGHDIERHRQRCAAQEEQKYWDMMTSY